MPSKIPSDKLISSVDLENTWSQFFTDIPVDPDTGKYQLDGILKKMADSGLPRITGGVDVLREVVASNGNRVWLDYHTTLGWGGGPFRYVTGASAGTYTHNGGTVLVPAAGDGSSAWLRDLDRIASVTDFGAIPDAGASVDQSAVFNAAIAAVQELFVPNGVYYANINISSKTHIFGFAQIRPFSNAPVITVFGNNGIWIEGLRLDWTGISTSWTSADGVNGGTSGSIDYVRIDNMHIAGSTGYGMYFYTTGGVVQRLRVRDCTVVDSQYANVRLEGNCLEHEFIGCFFNDGCHLGSSPARSLYGPSTRSATPDRAFRRGAVELLMEASGAAPVSVNTVLHPKRINFIGCNFVPSRDWDGTSGSDYRPAGLFIEAGRSVTVLGSNFEKPNPGLEIMPHPDQSAVSAATVLGPIGIYQNTFLLLSGDPLYYSVIMAGFVRGLYVEHNRMDLSGTFTTFPTAFLEWTESAQQSRSFWSLEHNVTPGNPASAITDMVGNYVKIWNPDGATFYWRSSRQAATSDDGVTTYSYLMVNGKNVIGYNASATNIDALGSNGSSDNQAGFTNGQRVTIRKCASSATLTLKNRTRDTTPIDVPGVFLLTADAILDTDIKAVTLEWDDFAGDRGAWIEIGRNF